MREFRALLLILILIARPEQARADVIGDANTLLKQLNPIDDALKGLIGEAASALDDVLQKQLEHLRSIIEMAIRQLNDVARQRIDQVDERARDQIADLNQLVQKNLLQFNALVGKHISTIDASLRQRINQFNYGIANDLASIKWLPTVPLLILDGNSITTFKQAGGPRRCSSAAAASLNTPINPWPIYQAARSKTIRFSPVETKSRSPCRTSQWA